MSRNKMERKIISLVMALLLILGMMPPVTVTAEEEVKSSSQMITSFANLEEDIAVQNVAFGTAENELNLPDKLSADVDSNQTDIHVTWESADYDGGISVDYIFTAKISDEYQLADGVTLPMITIRVQAAEEEVQEQIVSSIEETETTLPETAEPDAQAQSVTITIEEQDGSASLYLKANESIEEAALLTGVSALDEKGEAVEVTLEDLGGLNLSSPQYQSTPYTITYAAVHPGSGVKFTAVREVYVIGMSVRTSNPGNYIFDISEGDITIEPGSVIGNLKVTYGSTPSTTEVINTQPITIVGTNTANNKVVVKDGVIAKIILKNVAISNADESPFQLLGSSEVELTLSGTNTLTCSNTSYYMGTCAGLYVASTASITIAAETDDTTDSLTANGGIYGAGIGGSFISFNDDSENAAGVINIDSGEVTPTGGYYAAGIGGGYRGNGGEINITGGEVTASGGYMAAGIGGGCIGNGGTIAISGGTISATSGVFGPYDIGHGQSALGSNDSIKITGGSVYPVNSNYPSSVTDDSGNSVYLNILTIGDPDNNSAVGDGVLVTALNIPDASYYKIKDVYTINGSKVYFWLPQNDSNSASVGVTANGEDYARIWARTGNEETQTLYPLSKSVPNGKITVQTSSFDSFKTSITFKLFFKNTANVKITGEDTVSGVAKIEYIKTDTEMTETELKSTTLWSAYDNSLLVNANEKFIIYAKITNNARNSTIISSDGVVVYTDSEVTVDGGSFSKASSDDWEVTFNMNGNTVKSIVNDSNQLHEGADYTVEYTNTQEGTITFKNAYLKNLPDGTYQFTVTWYPLGETEDQTGGDTPQTTAITIVVSKDNQDTLSITGLGSSYTYGASSFNLSVSGGSGSGAVTYTSSDPSVASVTGNEVTIHKAGTFSITASKAADGEYNETTVTSGTVTVSEAVPTVTLEGANVSYGNDVTLTVTVSGAGTVPTGTVTFKEGDTVLSAETLVNVTASFTVTNPAAGNHSYIAEYSGQAEYYTAATGTKNIGVGMIDQAELSITGKPETVTYGDGTLTLETAGGSGTGTVTFSVPNDNVISITAAGEVTIKNAGTVTVTAVKAGDNNYNPCTAMLDITVSPRDISKVSVNVTGSCVYNGSQLQPGFTVSDGTLAINTGDYTNTYGENITAASGGSITLTGQRNYTGTKTVSFDILKAEPMEITFPTADTVTYDPGKTLADITLSGGAGDGTFAWEDDSIVPTVNNSGYELVFTPNDTDNYDYTGMTLKETVALTVNKAQQELTGLQDLLKINYGADFTVMPVSNASAENPEITFSSSDPSVIEIEADGNFVIKGDGTAVITVSAAETANYKAASASFEIRVLADTADLKDLITEAEKLLNNLDTDHIGNGNGQYPQEAVDEFEDAIDAAKETADKDTVTQAEIDQAKEELLKAIEDFQNSLIQVDFTELDNAIAQAENLSKSDYTTATWEVLENTLLAGKTIRETKWVTQAEADKAAKAILDAIDALVDLDITPPTGEITIKDNKWTSFLNTITFGRFFKNNVDITITGEDLESGVAEIEYYLSDEALPDITDWNDIDWSEINWATGEKVSITANWKGIVYARITDNQGNQTIISSNGVLIYTDSQQDTDSISFTRTDTTDVTASVILNGNKVSGINNGGYTLKADTDYTVNQDTGEIIFKADYLNSLTEGSYTLTVSYNPLGFTYINGQGNEAPVTSSINLTVSRAGQGISGVSGMTKTYGDPDFKVVTPSAQGNPVFTFKSSDTNVAAIAEDGTITITGAGETTITITAAATDDYEEAETSFKLTVEKAANSITNLASVNKTYGDESFTVEPSANENPEFSFTSSNPDVASIDPLTGETTITGSGSTTITVSASATANYKAASVTFSVNVANADGQVISGLGDYEKVYGDEPFTLTPAAYENPLFTYSSSNANVAAIDVNTGEVTIVGAGIAVITVTAAATSNYYGTSAVCVITVNKAEQIVSGLQNLIKVNGGDSFIVTPVTNAAVENPIISYQSSDVSVIDFDADGSFVIKGAGTATITVLAGETANFKSAAAAFDITVLEAESGLDSLEETITAAEDLVNGLDNEQIGDGDGQYPQEAVDELQDAINKAKDVADDENASQEEIDQAKEDLLNAIEEFENSLIQVDFYRLDNAITQGSMLNKSDYTAKSWEELENALLAGKTIRETKGVTQAEADTAAEEIFAAIAALESVYQFTTGFETFTGSGSATAAVNAPYDKFASLTVGGVLLDQDSYIVTEGSTVITLKETYLKTLANGTYAVTAAFTDGVAVTTLTVNVSEAKSVTGVTLDCSNAKVTVGKTLKLTATVIPSDAANQNLIWSSSDTSIAVVDANGKVTGIKAGSVIITVTTVDGGYSAACTVTVTAADSSDTDISPDTSDEVKTGDNQSIGLWISLLGASVLVFLFLGIYLERKGKLPIGKRK